MKTLKIQLIIILSLCSSIASAQLQYVGIPANTFNYYSAAQVNSNWCWAASLQMIFNYYGINIRQDQIVQRSYGTDPYGNLPNWAGSIPVITANLNNSAVDNNGRAYVVQSSVYWGAPTPTFLINELQAQRPVLVGYRSGPSSGHAVVITAVSYYATSSGPQIQTIVVRDPWPSNENIANVGRVEYPGSNLANLITSHWYIRIY